MREAVAPGHAASCLAKAQDQLRRLELLQLQPAKRIEELEGALHGQPAPEPAPELPARRRSDVADDHSDCESILEVSEMPSTPEAPSRHLPVEVTDVAYPSHSHLPQFASSQPVRQLGTAGYCLCSLEPCLDASPWAHFGSCITPGSCADEPNSVWLVPPTELMWYVVTFISGIDIRAFPDANGPRTGIILTQCSVFSVSEVVSGFDGRAYLRLSDGRGWAFDDFSHFPNDPSVRRLPPGQHLMYDGFVPPPPPFPAPAIPAPPDYSPSIFEGQVSRQRGTRGGAKRRKRGGVKHRPRSEA